MKFFIHITLAASILICSLGLRAAAPQHQSMEITSLTQKNTQLTAQNAALQQQLAQKQKPSCCDILGDKCNSVGNRADICFFHRCAAPFKIATCQTDAPCFKKKFSYGKIKYCTPETRVRNLAKLVASCTCCLPVECACCPVYACCGAESARTCLGLQ